MIRKSILATLMALTFAGWLILLVPFFAFYAWLFNEPYSFREDLHNTLDSMKKDLAA